MILRIHNSNQAVFDTAATSSAGKSGDNFIPTTKRSDKVFNQPSGTQMEATYVHKLKHNVRDPVGRVDIVTDLAQEILISGPKFAEAGYVTLLTPKELLIFDGEDLKITVSAKACGECHWNHKKTPMQSKYVL